MRERERAGSDVILNEGVSSHPCEGSDSQVSSQAQARAQTSADPLSLSVPSGEVSMTSE